MMAAFSFLVSANFDHLYQFLPAICPPVPDSLKAAMKDLLTKSSSGPTSVSSFFLTGPGIPIFAQ